MKQIIYKNNTDGAFYMTPYSNYNAYIVDPRKIKKLAGVKTEADVYDFIINLCSLYDDKEDNYIVLGY